jgi:hypothetical protein
VDKDDFADAIEEACEEAAEAGLTKAEIIDVLSTKLAELQLMGEGE